MPILPASESEKVEFKTSFNEDVIETLVAFSNAKGGTVEEFLLKNELLLESDKISNGCYLSTDCPNPSLK